MLLHRASFRIIFARSRLTNTSPTGSQEAETLQRLYPKLAPYLSQAGRNQVAAKGTSYTWRKEALVGLNHARASLASIYRHGVDLLGRVTPSSVYRYRDKHRTTVLDFGLCATSRKTVSSAVAYSKPIAPAQLISRSLSRVICIRSAVGATGWVWSIPAFAGTSPTTTSIVGSANQPA